MITQNSAPINTLTPMFRSWSSFISFFVVSCLSSRRSTVSRGWKESKGEEQRTYNGTRASPFLLFHQNLHTKFQNSVYSLCSFCDTILEEKLRLSRVTLESCSLSSRISCSLTSSRRIAFCMEDKEGKR